MPASNRRTKLDDLFETRVHAATGRRAAKQNKGHNRVLLFAGGLFLASVGGIAAAYYLVGPPMALSSYNTDAAGLTSGQPSSLEVDSNTVGTSSHFIQGIPASTKMSGNATDYLPGAPAMVQPPAAYDQTDTVSVTRDPVAPSIAEQPVANAVPAQSKSAEPQQNDVTAVITEEPADTLAKTVVAQPETERAAQPETERMVRIVPTAVSEEVETKTNVNASKAPATSGGSAGQWVALPAETRPAAPSAVTAAAPQKSSPSDPVVGDSVKTQQELFKAFQTYLESSGHTVTGDNQGQEELFNKFIRWSMEAPKEN